jgi:hypothetical protein
MLSTLICLVTGPEQKIGGDTWQQLLFTVREKTNFPWNKGKYNSQGRSFSSQALVPAAFRVLGKFRKEGSSLPPRHGRRVDVSLAPVISTLRLMRRMLSKSGFWFGDTCSCVLIDFWAEIELGDVICRCVSLWWQPAAWHLFHKVWLATSVLSCQGLCTSRLKREMFLTRTESQM